MFDFYAEEDFDRTVYVVNHPHFPRKIIEMKLELLCEEFSPWIEFCNKRYPVFDDICESVEGKPVTLYRNVFTTSRKWVKIKEFGSLEEARHARFLLYKLHLDSNLNAPRYYDTYEEAKKRLDSTIFPSGGTLIL